MFGINGSEFIILALLAVLILGPDKLPGYAQQLAQLVKNVRRMANGAKEQLREEVGDEITEIEWRKLDPRQYDPRRIIKEALLDDFEDAARAAKESPSVPTARKSIPSSTPAVTPTLPAAAQRLEAGERAPFDLDAT
ncbi:sec-independent translocase [Zhihengliuella flava]|uniref:Sec-independent protein translocase protein TatB n=1 Tax=Zhihengliuella flava TaxID=1285193 RepID=A0A931GFS0_9MICC|nr:sec-independent protein translocase protein TatB [Zhihengliuella flava]